MTDAQFPTVIDNTVLSDWRRCPQYFFRKRVQGLRPKDEGLSIDLHFGVCLAKGMQVARESHYADLKHIEEAHMAGIHAAVEQWFSENPSGTRNGKTEVGLVETLWHAFNTWPLDSPHLTPIPGMVNAGVEFAFQIELPIDHPETGEPLRYAGRCDFVGQEAFGNLVIVDEKTTGNLSDAWMARWDMDPQMTGYIWAMQKISPGANVSAQGRGLSVYALKKDGAIRVSHATVNVFRTQHQIDLWHAQMLEDVATMCLQWFGWKRSGEISAWSYRLGSACTAYGRACEFTRLCGSPNPERLLDGYTVEFWSPLTEKGGSNGS